MDVFITGTDTEVGKTAMSCAVARMLKNDNINVGVMKPVASGCFEENGELLSEDSVALRKAAGVNDSYSLVNPVALCEALSPHMAARLEGADLTESIAREKVFAAYRELKEKHDSVVVEGVGGALVPIIGRYTVADMAAEFALPVIIVAADRLGMISHTLLTIECMQARNLNVAGVIVNRMQPDSDYSSNTNIEALTLVTDVPVFGPVPFQNDPQDFDAAADALKKTGIGSLLETDAG